MTAITQGKLKVTLNNHPITLHNVLLVPQLLINLFRVPALTKHGSSVHFSSKQVQLHLPSTKTLTLTNHSRLTNLYAILIPRLAAPSVAALTP